MLKSHISESQNFLLKPYIERYIYVKGSGNLPPKKLPPRPGASLIFEFADPFRIDNKSFQQALSGLQTGPITYKSASTGTEHLVIQFSSFGLNAFITGPLSELTNMILKPEDIFGKEIDHLYERLRSISSFEDRIQEIEYFLINQLSDTAIGDNAMSQIANLLREKTENVSFKDILKQTSLSLRQIERKFKAIVGVDIQTYIRLSRFDRARSLLLQDPSSKLTEVGYKAGYYDQPHFSNDVNA